MLHQSWEHLHQQFQLEHEVLSVLHWLMSLSSSHLVPGICLSGLATGSPSEMQQCFSLPSELHVLDADSWPTYHMHLTYRVSENKRGSYTVKSSDGMPLSKSPCLCEPQLKEHFSWLSFIFKIKIAAYYLSYHVQLFLPCGENPGENGDVSKLCPWLLGGLHLRFWYRWCLTTLLISLARKQARHRALVMQLSLSHLEISTLCP